MFQRRLTFNYFEDGRKYVKKQNIEDGLQVMKNSLLEYKRYSKILQNIGNRGTCI